MPEKRRRNELVLLLPLLHLCACFTIALGRLNSGWEYLTYIDLPVSVLILSASYRFDHPLILFGAIGTLWWYMSSRLAEIWITRFISYLGGRDCRAQGTKRG